MIYLCHEPEFSLGIFSAKFAEELTSKGAYAECTHIGSNSIARLILRTFPLRKKRLSVSAFVNAVLLRKSLEHRIHRNDVVIVYEGMGVVSPFFDCALQRAVKRKGAKYIAVIPDAWPISSEHSRAACAIRVALADLTLGVTPNLTRMLACKYPKAACDLFEEPIDTTAFQPVFDRGNRMPVVTWSGPPRKIVEIEQSRHVLEHAHKHCPFVLRVITGDARPKIKIDIPFEWMPFSQHTYNDQFRNSDIAFARYKTIRPDYAECKGNYKIKTYMAAGCAIITDPIGYNNDLIKHGENGLLAKTDNEWVEGLLTLLSDADLRIKMRMAARESCIARFSYKSSAQRLIDVLEKNNIQFKPHLGKF